MSSKQIIAAPAYLHETILHQILDLNQTNVLGNTAVIPASALMPKQEFSSSFILEKCFERIQSCKNRCPHFSAMIDNPSFLKQLYDFHSELEEYSLSLDDLPAHDDFQKELKILLESLNDLPGASKNQIDFLNSLSSYSHVKLYPAYQHSIFSSTIQDHLIHHGAQLLSFSESSPDRIGHTALNRKQELEACAQYITAHNLNVQDVMIVLCDPTNDQQVLRLVFDRYGIPYGFTSKSESSKIVKLFLSSVSFMRNQSINSLLEFLHAGYHSLHSFDSLVNYIHLFVESIEELLVPFSHVSSSLLQKSILDEFELNQLIELEKEAELVRQQISLLSGKSILIEAYEFCRNHKLAQDENERHILFQIKSILEEHASVIENNAYLDLICFEIEQLSIHSSDSISNTICVTDLTHPVPARKYAFVMGCIQSSFPNFKACSGIFDEDYVSQVRGYPNKTTRQKFNSNQTSWIFYCAKQIIFSSSSSDYEGKGRQMSVEIESKLNGKTTPWKIGQYSKKYKVDFKISPSTSESLFFKKNMLHGSISSFERWFNCPASYFLKYGLKLKKKSLPEFNIALMGTLQHALLEEVITRYEKNIQLCSKEELIEIANQLFDPVIYLFKKQHVHLSLAKDRCVKNMTMIFEFLGEMESNTDFIPQKHENKFTFTLFEDDIHPLCIHGIIDRIDMTHDMLRILDYKSSHKTLSLSKARSGLQLQLLTYLYVASCIYQKTAAGCYYVSLKNDDIKAPTSKVDARRFEVIDPEVNQERELWIQSHRLDGLTFADTNMLDFDGRHIKNFKNGMPSKIYSLDDLSGFIHAVYTYLTDQLASGTIDLTPTEDACMFCDYFSICRFHSLKVKNIVPEEITSSYFTEVKKL